MEALNTIVAEENNKLSAPETSRAERGITLRDRLLFNPQGSAANNGEVQGFLFFFSSMFFTFATIGMIPRLRMTGQLAQTMEEGTPFAILSRLVPYCACLMTALTVGMVILHYLNDMAFAGSVWLFFLTQCFYIPAVGVMSLLFGWNAANPGVAASRMILFIPMGFILGGATSPLMEQSLWVRYFAHFFPLTWEYEFTRDITLRGAGFWDIAPEFGGFLIYFACLIIVFCLVFYGTRPKELARQKEEHA